MHYQSTNENPHKFNWQALAHTYNYVPSYIAILYSEAVLHNSTCVIYQFVGLLCISAYIYMLCISVWLIRTPEYSMIWMFNVFHVLVYINNSWKPCDLTTHLVCAVFWLPYVNHKITEAFPSNCDVVTQSCQ